MPKLVEEMEVVVGRHPPFYCKVGWSVVGKGRDMSNSHHDECRVTVQRKGPSVNAGGEKIGTCQSFVDNIAGGCSVAVSPTLRVDRIHSG